MTQTVLVTGASGFIAAHILKDFLDAGYHVRAAVRSDRTAERVRTTHGAYGDALSFILIPDIAAPGAFDEAIKGVDGVIHTASPFVLNAKDFDKDLFEPAVNGTMGVLAAAKNFNPNVKRIVITSSFASVMDYSKGTRPGHIYTEDQWNPMTAADARESKDPTAAYLVSKVLAEHAAFDFVEKEKPNFSVATLTPPMVYGPISHAVDSMSSLNTSSADMYRLINGTETEVPPTGFWAYIDVRDLSKAHLLAYESPEAANQRYLVAGAAYSYQKFVDIIREKFPELRDTTPEGTPNQPLPDVYKLDTSKVQKQLGLKFRPMEETVVDTINSLKDLEKRLA